MADKQQRDVVSLGLNQVLLTADVPLEDEGMEAHFVVRYVGCSGETLRFSVRRRVTDEGPRAALSGPRPQVFVPRGGIIGSLPQTWECYVPLQNGEGIATWWFGDAPGESVTERYRLGRAGELIVIDPEELSSKPKAKRPIGFRQPAPEDD
jgi:hypothetical protein